MVYDTKEEILRLGEMDGELKEFLDANPMPKQDFSDLEAFVKIASERMEAGKDALGPVPSTMTATELTYTTTDGTSLRARLFKPANPPKEGSPLVVLYHGGGFCLGGPEGEEQTCRLLVTTYNAVCVSMQYRLAPKFPFPYAIDDSWDALKWAAANATSFGANPSLGFVVGGTSAGGNIAAVLAHLARDHNLSPPLTAQYLAIPAVCPPDKLPEKYSKYFFSYEQNKNAPGLGIEAIDMLMRGYKPDENDNIKYAVLNHPKGHKGLPKAYIQIDGMDPLRDEALIYERILREECGVQTKMDMYPGLPHGHWGFFPFLKSSDKFRREQVKGFAWLLGKEPVEIEVDAKPASV